MNTSIEEIAANLYRINTPITEAPGGFSFNQYLLVDEAPLLFHTGQSWLFKGVTEAIAKVMPLEHLKYVAYSHYEPDECGAMDLFLARCPNAIPVGSKIAEMLTGGSFMRPMHGMRQGDLLDLGQHKLRWHDTPHLPHGWDSGLLFDETTNALFCGDLFTQPGAVTPALTTSDILGPSESMRKPMDYYCHNPHTHEMLARLAALKPTTLACMHGSAWQGDGKSLLLALSEALKEDSRERAA